jgi:hypothetical protein
MRRSSSSEIALNTLSSTEEDSLVQNQPIPESTVKDRKRRSSNHADEHHPTSSSSASVSFDYIDDENLGSTNAEDDHDNKKQKNTTMWKAICQYMNSIRLMVLVVLCLQTSLYTLLRRYSQGVRQEVYSKVSAVCCCLMNQKLVRVFSATEAMDLQPCVPHFCFCAFSFLLALYAARTLVGSRNHKNSILRLDDLPWASGWKKSHTTDTVSDCNLPKNACSRIHLWCHEHFVVRQSTKHFSRDVHNLCATENHIYRYLLDNYFGAKVLVD